MAVTILGSGASPVVGSRTLTNFGTGTEYTFSNGLTNTNNTITLGGVLSSSVLLINNNESNGFEIRNIGSATASTFKIIANSSAIDIYGWNDAAMTGSSGYGGFSTGANYAQIEINNGSNSSTFDVSTTQIKITDAINTIGLQYAADYSTNGKAVTNDLWIPDWASVIGYNTASNGLTMTTGNVVLGGALTGNTAIDGNFDLDIGVSTPLNDVNILTDNTVSIGITDGGDITAFAISTSGIAVRDDGAEVGMFYAGDYTTNGVAFGNRWIPDKEYVDTAIATAENNMKVAKATLVYTEDDDASKTIITLDADDVVWSIKTNVTEVFDDSTSNNLTIGYTANTDYYTGNGNDTTTLVSTGWVSHTTDVPHIPGATNVVCAYNGVGTGSSTGAAEVYVHYSKH